MALPIRGRRKPNAVLTARSAAVQAGMVFAWPYDAAFFVDRASPSAAGRHRSVPPATAGTVLPQVGSIGRGGFNSSNNNGALQVLLQDSSSAVLWPADDTDWTLRFIFEASNVTGFHALYRNGSGGASDVASLYIHNGRIENAHSAAQSNSTIAVLTLYDLIVTHVKGALLVSVFLNGVPDGTISSTASWGMSGIQLQFWGDSFTNQGFVGMRYLVQGWNRVLTVGEISARYRDFWLDFTKPGFAAVKKPAAGGTFQPAWAIPSNYIGSGGYAT